MIEGEKWNKTMDVACNVRPVWSLGLGWDENECGDEWSDNMRCKGSAFAGLERSMLEWVLRVKCRKVIDDSWLTVFEDIPWWDWRNIKGMRREITYLWLGTESRTRAIFFARDGSSTTMPRRASVLCTVSTTLLKDEAAPRSCLKRTKLRLAWWPCSKTV